MKILADVSGKPYFAKLARKLMMLPSETRISDNGVYGVSDIKPAAAATRIDQYLASEGPVVYRIDKVDIKKVCGFYCARAEYVDTDNDSLISMSVCGSEAGTLICVAEVEL